VNTSWTSALLLLGIVLTTGELHPSAQPPQPSIYIEDLTWTELRDAIRSGKNTVLVPIGGTEQSGPAIALGKHNVRAKVLAGKIAQELGNALVAPVIAYVPEGAINPPTQHMRYPGTITIPDDAFSKTLEYAARSMKQAGFQNIVFLGDHGGYQALEKNAAAKLAREWNSSGVRVIALEEYYRASTDTFEAILLAHGYTLAQTGRHAGLMDTSLQMAVAPATVRADRLSGIAPNSDGVEGDPRKSSSALGELAVTEIVNGSVAAIRKYVAQH
jgi:creatinine amidohydrolase/Fe(II)-dependent formamide hydrolase-like protein